MKKKLTTVAYGFRLDPRIPSEAKVIEIFDAFVDRTKGVGIRQIITISVLATEGLESLLASSDSSELRQIRLMTDEFRKLLEEAREFYQRPLEQTSEYQQAGKKLHSRLQEKISSFISVPKEYE